MQSMQALPKIPPNAFGNLGISVEVDGKSHEITLKPYEDYSDEIRPKTFNELPPVLVLQAVEKGLLSVSWSPKDIKKELYWNAHHWSKFLFGNKDKINYHEIVEWCAQKEKIVGDPVVSKKEIDALSTYDLSQVVSEKYLAKQFNDLWNKLDLDQKGETISELESKTGKKFTEFQRKTLINWDSATREDKARVCKELNESNRNTGTGQVVLSASMGAGAVVLGGLGVAVSVMGFAFYTTVTSMIAFVAASLGTTLAFSVYTTTTTTLAVLSGPWGWCIAGGLLVLSPFAVGWADTEKCANFIVAKHTIESSWLLPTTGGGVETNREEGLMWLRRAAENGSENAKKYLEELDGDETGGGSEASSPSASTTEDDSLLTVSLGDNVSMTFVTISEGKFTMGSPKSEDGRYTDENQVSVELNPFWIGQTEVTQAQWKSVMGNNPSRFKGDSLPVECVSWDEAMEFCRKLTERERKKGLPEDYKFTLPTEAQWEYACRAGTTMRFSFGNSDRNLYLYGNFYDRSGDTKYDAAFREKNGWKIPPDTSQDDGFVETAPVGSFRPNAWGLYDMHGNVREWCSDYYNLSLSGGTDPVRISPGNGKFGSDRVIRGGSWSNNAQYCRSAFRGYNSPDSRNNSRGFRVALVQE